MVSITADGSTHTRSAAIERERLANMRADQAEEALAAVQQVQSIELERLREFQAKVEEAEARCCPEDVGFEEWIGELERRLGGTNAMASQAIGLLRQAYGHVALTAKLGSPHATTLAAELDAFLDTLPQPPTKEPEPCSIEGMIASERRKEGPK